MGYYISHIESDFKILKADMSAVQQVLRDRRIEECPRYNRHPDDLKSVFDELRWLGWCAEVSSPNSEYGLDCFWPDTDRLTSEEEWMNEIAPYVVPGSWIEMMGEDGCFWKWIFDGECCQTVYGKVEYPDEDAVFECIKARQSTAPELVGSLDDILSSGGGE